MKNITVKVPFFINKNNMEYLLKGNIISNFDEVHKKMIFSNPNEKPCIYIARENDINRPKEDMSEYANLNDIIVAKANRYIEEGDNIYLEVDIIDSLYYHKLKEPCIKINGYCEIESGSITITKVTRITLADKSPTIISDAL